MPNAPLRGVGSIGIITDLEPQDLPAQAWSSGMNVRFANGKLSRYSVFKLVNDTYAYTKVPIGVLEGGGVDESGALVTVFSDGTMEQLYQGTTTDVTPAGVLGLSESHITTSRLGGVVFVNRQADVPIYRKIIQDGSFVPIPGWDITDRCMALRSYKDFLIAINVSKNGVPFEGMVKWSDATQFGAPPLNWDVVNPASLAGETVLNDIKAPLVDGLSMGRTFMIYGQKQVYRMDFVGGEFIFEFNEVFPDRGAITLNCVANINNLHYVFGEDDIYVHDGIQHNSLVQGKCSDFIFGDIEMEMRDRCFVYHDSYNNEVVFAYPSLAQDCAWDIETTQGCNRAFVYNYKDRTVSHIDLPGVLSASQFSITNSRSWDDPNNWNEMDASWSGLVGKKPDRPVLSSTGNGVVTAKPYIMDTLFKGRLGNQVANDVFFPAYVQKDYLDMDDLGAELYNTKGINYIVPQIVTSDIDDTVIFQIGSSSNLNVPIVYEPERPMSPHSQEKFDSRVTGRYLGIKMTIPSGVHANLSGFDFDANIIAGR